MTHDLTPITAILLRGCREFRKYDLNVVETKTSIPVLMAQQDVARYLAECQMAEEGAQTYKEKLCQLRTAPDSERAVVPPPVNDDPQTLKVTRLAAYVEIDRYGHEPCGLKPSVWDVFRRPRPA